MASNTVGKLVIVRHGLTEWSGKFTGWTDVDIIPEGITYVKKYGQKLKEEGYLFDIAYTSYLKRAIRTLWWFMSEIDQMYLPVHNYWQFNERHYGALQGLSKAETAQKLGEEQVNIWRRSYNTAPPPLTYDDKRHPRFEAKYRHLDPRNLPLSESLADTYKRAVPMFKETIHKDLMAGKNVIFSAHNNSLRAIIKHMDNLSDEEVMKLNIAYSIPLVYEFHSDGTPKKHYYLESDEVVQKVIEAIKNQAKGK